MTTPTVNGLKRKCYGVGANENRQCNRQDPEISSRQA